MTDKQLTEWKNKYGDIFKKKINDIDVYYRQLTSEEYEKLSRVEKKVDQIYIENMMLDKCVLEPKNIREVLGSESIALTQLAGFILRTSMVTEEQLMKVADECRERNKKDVFKRLIAGVITHIPTYDIKELENMTINQLIDVATFAEMVPVNPNVIEAPIIVNPNEKKTLTMPEANNIPPPMINNQKKAQYSSQDLQKVGMGDAAGALAQEMAQHGKSYPTLEEKLEVENNKPKTLAQQIREQQKNLRTL